MKIVINYRSNALLPADITDILEETKDRLPALSMYAVSGGGTGGTTGN
ncbi:MAG: hypothetical protein LBE17_01165 [Treponema sp.]|jgi:hypothetical protein|nr:hypothetical protein [Treponema sp.]